LTSSFSGNDKITHIRCTDTEIKTFIVHINLYEDEIELPPEIEGALYLLPSGGNLLIPSELDLVPAETVPVPVLDFSEFMSGMSFKSVKTKLYISGSDILDILSIKLIVDGGAPQIFQLEQFKSESGLDDTEFDGNELPEGGLEITLPFDGQSFDISYSLFIEQNTLIPRSILDDDKKVYIEIAVWLPMDLEADDDGALFKFPDDFFPNEDLFGRKSPEDSNPVNEMIESLMIVISLNKNPFSDAVLVITSTDAITGNVITIENPFNNNALTFGINSMQMMQINKDYPFAPKFSVKFAKGGALLLPMNFKATEFAFKAKLNFRKEIWTLPL